VACESCPESSRVLPQLRRAQRSKFNTILNIVPQGQVQVVERMGRFLAVEQPGFYFAFPFIDKISYVVDTREMTLPISPAPCVTKDNVSVKIDGVVFVKSTDTYKTAYGASDPYIAVTVHAQSVMRAAIGRRTLDEAFHDRSALNNDIYRDIAASAENWGLVVLRYEVLNIEADLAVAKAMDLQATAERRRRERVTTAEADRTSAVLNAQGRAEAAEREAEATKRVMILEAEGEAERVRTVARAEADRMLLQANAQAEALRVVGEQMQSVAGTRAAGMELAREYLHTMGEGMKQSNTIMLTGGGGAGQGVFGGFDESLARSVALAGTVSSAIQSHSKASPGGHSKPEADPIVDVDAHSAYPTMKAEAYESSQVGAEMDATVESARHALDRVVAERQRSILEHLSTDTNDRR
jgi:regulator of protease activity HflC (stomatin/prohibitin superfamily)